MSDQDQDKDPVVHSSLSRPLFIWSALLLLSLGWALYDPFQEVRSHIGSLTYQIETTNSQSSKESMRREIEQIKKEIHTVKLPMPDGTTKKVDYDYARMDRDLLAWKNRKAQLLQE